MHWSGNTKPGVVRVNALRGIPFAPSMSQSDPPQSARATALASLGPAMCMQCTAAALTSVGAAAGLRSALAAWIRSRFGPAALSRLTIALGAAALLVSAVAIGGSGV